MKRLIGILLTVLGLAAGSLAGNAQSNEPQQIVSVPAGSQLPADTWQRSRRPPPVSSGNPEYIVSIWQTSDGLPSDTVTHLAQTPEGYLWLGTPRGLAHFDGLRFQAVAEATAGLPPDAPITALEVDAQGRLWGAANRGELFCWQTGRLTAIPFASSSPPTNICNLCRDGHGGFMWVDAEGKLGQLLDHPPYPVTRLADRVGPLSRWERDGQDQLWLLCKYQVKKYQAQTLADYALPWSREVSHTTTPRQQGGLWVARLGKLQFVLPDGTMTEVANFPWKRASQVTCLREDRQQRLWIGTLSQGLFCFENNKITQVVPTAAEITCLYQDTQDVLWVGTQGGGLMRVQPRQFIVQELGSKAANGMVQSLAQDQDGQVWAALANKELGVWRADGWHKMQAADGWLERGATCVAPAQDGGIWLATTRSNLWHWNQTFTEQPLPPTGLPEPAINLLEDRQGRLWMITANAGVFYWQAGQLQPVTFPANLAALHVRRVVEDHAGNIWFGDWAGGVVRWREGEITLVRPPTRYRDAVQSMVVVGDTLWIGTSSGNLLRLQAGQTAVVSVAQGLPDASIHQLLADDQGALWGATSHRLFRLPLASLEAVIAGRERQVQIAAYGRADGVPDTLFANLGNPGCRRMPDGELWFATLNGALHFQPAHLADTHVPQAVMEQVRFNGQPLTPNAWQRLRPGPGRLEFIFSAPCLTAPDRVQFRGQFSGVDADWVDLGAARSAVYSYIPAGRHEFRVRADGPAGTWSSPPATVVIIARPGFWQTTWFWTVLAAGAVALGMALVRLTLLRKMNRRVAQLQQQNLVVRERARIAQDIHDELGANLTSISLLADLGVRHKANPQAVSGDLAQIAQTARESVAAMDVIVWALNPKNDSLDHCANYIAQFTREMFGPTAIKTRLILPDDLPAYPLDAETRHQILLLLKESFNNIIRHAAATEVQVELAAADGQLHLRIADNGQGLPPATTDDQNGLLNLRARAEKLGGSLLVTSQPAAGTQLQFTLPLNRLLKN